MRRTWLLFLKMTVSAWPPPLGVVLRRVRLAMAMPVERRPLMTPRLLEEFWPYWRRSLLE